MQVNEDENIGNVNSVNISLGNSITTLKLDVAVEPEDSIANVKVKGNVDSVNNGSEQSVTGEDIKQNFESEVVIFYTNCDFGLPNKKEELLAYAESHSPHIIALTEVKPKFGAKLSVEDLGIPNYDVIEHNIEDTGRGIAILARNNIHAETAQDIKTDGFKEAVFVKVISAKSNLLIGVVYRSPNSGTENSVALSTMLDDLCRKERNMVLIGDFNHPSIDWSSTVANGIRIDRMFHGTILDNLLNQLVAQPTRYREGQKPTLDDLVLVNDANLVEDIEYKPPLGNSDHVCIMVKVKHKAICQDTRSKDTRFIYNRGQYEDMREALQAIDWVTHLEDKDTTSAWDTFKGIMEANIALFIPTIAPGKKKATKKSVYLDKEALDKVRRKNHAWKEYMRDKTVTSYDSFAKERNELRVMTRRKKENFESKLAHEVKDNPKAFWNYANRKTSSKDSMPDLVGIDGVTAKTDTEKANALNSQFASVFTDESIGNLPRTQVYRGASMEVLQVTADIVCKKLTGLNPNKSAGPDGLHCRVLKETAEQVAAPLALIFNKSLTEGRVPTDWKHATVTPIYKRKGEKTNPVNYRPISLTCVVCKLLESIIREELLSFILQTGQLSEQQHGFLPGKSCVTNQIETLDIVTSRLDDKKPVDIIYIDFSKAFDKVPHQRLLLKMSSMGISDQVVQWVQDFLSDRKMRVLVNGSFSAWLEVKSGIPQGSVLGPTLFTIYVNDLPPLLSSPSRMLADDLKILREVIIQQDSLHLQEDIERVCRWCKIWLLTPNAAKCKVLHVGQKNPSCHYTMEVDGVRGQLQVVTGEKDLGVHIDNKLSFQQHITETSNKATRILWAIKRTFSTRKGPIMKRLYTTLVRPHLEYCNAALILKNKGDIDKLERVQRRATKMVTELRNLPYQDRLRRLDLQSFTFRRRRGDMIQTFKYVKGINKCRLEDLLPKPRTMRCLRGHSEKLAMPRARTNLRKHSFTHRIVPSWNALSQFTVNATTVNTFKNRLDKEWKEKMFDC